MPTTDSGGSRPRIPIDFRVCKNSPKIDNFEFRKGSPRTPVRKIRLESGAVVGEPFIRRKTKHKDSAERVRPDKKPEFVY